MGIRFSDWVASLTAKGAPASGDLVVILDSAASNAPKQAEVGDLPGTGGGGAVATDAIWDAKGDLAAGTGANTAVRVPVGANGHVFTADSAEPAGVKWAAPSIYTDEQARDAIGAALVAGEGIDITVNDAGDSITIDAEAASDINAGIVELATTAETQTGTDATRAVTPAGASATYVPLPSAPAQVAHIINTDAGSGRTIYVGSIDPDVSYTPAVGDVWIEVP